MGTVLVRRVCPISSNYKEGCEAWSPGRDERQSHSFLYILKTQEQNFPEEVILTSCSTPAHPQGLSVLAPKQVLKLPRLPGFLTAPNGISHHLPPGYPSSFLSLPCKPFYIQHIKESPSIINMVTALPRLRNSWPTPVFRINANFDLCSNPRGLL